MKMNKIIKVLAIFLLLFLISCGGKEKANAEGEAANAEQKSEESAPKEEAKKQEGKEGEQGTVEDANMFYVEDLIVNPYNSGGRRILLTSFAIELNKPNMKEELSEKKYLLNDLLLKIFGSKTVAQLSSPNFKDTLRIEISNTLKNNFKKVKVKNVYFSKYIIQ
jgi:flagellar basal body-associated protein FliL